MAPSLYRMILTSFFVWASTCLCVLGQEISTSVGTSAVSDSATCSADSPNGCADDGKPLTPLEIVKKKQAEVQLRIKKNTLDMASIWEMCELKEKEFRLQGRTRSTFATLRVTDCLQTFMSAVQMVQMLARSGAKRGEPDEEDEEEEDDTPDPEELPFWQFFQYATVSSQRLLMFSEGSVGRFDSGVKFLGEILKNKTYCHNATKQHPLTTNINKHFALSCAAAYADLLLMTRLMFEATGIDPASSRGAVQKEKNLVELQAHWKASQELPHPIPWVSENEIHLQLPGLRAKPYWECNELRASSCAWLQELEAQVSTIGSDLATFMSATESGKTFGFGIDDVNEHIAWRLPGSKTEPEGVRWSSVALLVNQTWDAELCDSFFAATCALLRGRPELDDKNFFYSWTGPGAEHSTSVSQPVLMVQLYRLRPGTWLRPHFGTHARLTASLGLLGTEDDTGKPQAILRVGGQERKWQHGKMMIFDDVFEHEVRLPVDADPRHVLTLSMLHPDAMQG